MSTRVRQDSPLRTIRSLSGRSRLIALVAALAVIAGLSTWALWPDPPRQREYLDATACLITDEKGVTGEAARPVWAAMREASEASLVRVQYLPVNGPQTVDNATTHLASLAVSRCGAVIAVGQAQVDAVARSASGYPGVRFLTVGGSPAANVQVLDAGSAESLRLAVRERLDTLADDAS